MVKSDVDLYLEAVNKKLVCPRRIRKKFLSQLSADVTELTETCKSEPTTADLEARFGTPEEVAVNYLHAAGFSEVRESLSSKRIVVICVITACIIALVGVFGYILFDNWRQEDFLNGRVETIIYEADGTPPPLPEGAEVH